MNPNKGNKFFNENGKQMFGKYDSIVSSKTSSKFQNNKLMSSFSSPSSMPIDNFNDGKISQSPETLEGINRNYWHRGELMELVVNPMDELEFCTEVFLEQKIELLEVLTGYETPNRYHVYMVTKTGKKKYLFKCKEESSWGCRNCCPSSSRAFEMKMIHIKSSNKTVNYKQTIANISRPFTCTFCNCKRPKMTSVFNSDKTKERITLGSVVENFSCDPSLNIYTQNNQLKWKIKSNCCQCGFICRCFSIGKCYEVDFWIYDADEFNNVKYNAVGNIHKVFKGMSELITDTDTFLLTFPKNATTKEKMMLITAVLMIDYRYYEETAMCNLSGII